MASILESTEYKEAPFKIIVAHIPPAVTEAGPDEDWHGNVEVEQKFMPLLRQAYPDLMLCGPYIVLCVMMPLTKRLSP